MDLLFADGYFAGMQLVIVIKHVRVQKSWENIFNTSQLVNVYLHCGELLTIHIVNIYHYLSHVMSIIILSLLDYPAQVSGIAVAGICFLYTQWII